MFDYRAHRRCWFSVNRLIQPYESYSCQSSPVRSTAVVLAHSPDIANLLMGVVVVVAGWRWWRWWRQGWWRWWWLCKIFIPRNMAAMCSEPGDRSVIQPPKSNLRLPPARANPLQLCVVVKPANAQICLAAIKIFGDGLPSNASEYPYPRHRSFFWCIAAAYECVEGAKTFAAVLRRALGLVPLGRQS